MRGKKILAAVLSLIVALSLCACGQRGGEGTTLTVFAAASLEETLRALGSAYMEEHEAVGIVFNFDSSGTLKTQLQEGAEADIFISAGQEQMDELAFDDGDGTGLLLEGTRFDLLENSVVLAVPEGNPAGIVSYEDMAARLAEGTLLLAMGNSDVPVGQYTGKILRYYGLDEAALAAMGCLTYGSNVKEVTTQLCEGMVSCGVIYGTDALSAGLPVVDRADSEMCGEVSYPAAVLRDSHNVDEAEAFLAYLRSEEAAAVFEAAGFAPAA